MESIKPIETSYNGYKFRSRLEARWAVFFDWMHIKYQYELDGFKGYGGTPYLPDFYFPDYDVYGEIKATDEQLFYCQEKISGAIDFNTTPVSKGLLLFGPIPYPEDGVINHYQVEGSMLSWNEGIMLSSFLIQSFNECGRFLLQTEIHSDYSSWPSIPKKTSVEMKIVDSFPDPPSLLSKALRAARSERFDHEKYSCDM